MQGIFLKGKSVLEAEIEGCKRIPEEERVYYRDHILNEDGEGEPHGRDQEIVIARNMDQKTIANLLLKWKWFDCFESYKYMMEMNL